MVVQVFKVIVATLTPIGPPILLTIVVKDFRSIEDLVSLVSLLPYFVAGLKLILLIAELLFGLVFLHGVFHLLLYELTFFLVELLPLKSVFEFKYLVNLNLNLILNS